MPQETAAEPAGFSDELTRLTYQNARTTVLINLVNAGLLALVMQEVLPWAVTLLWVVAILAVTGWRWRNARAYRRRGDNTSVSPRAWGQRYTYGALAAGVLWGTAGALMAIHGELIHQTFSAFVLGGLTAGSLALHAAVVRTFLAFLFPALLPVAAVYLLRGDQYSLMLGSLILLFTGTMVVVVHRLNRSIVRAVSLGVENRSLVASLTEAKQRLEGSEQTFRVLAETTSSAIFVWSERFLYVNPATERLSGYSADELLGMRFWQFIHPDQQAEVKERGIRRVRGESPPNHYEMKIVARNGETRWLDFCGEQIEWQGETAAIGTAFDITVRKKAEEQLQLAASVFTHAHEGIMITSASGTIIDVNDSFTRITGYERDEVLGRNPRILRSGRQDEAFYADMWRQLTEQGRWAGEVWNRRRDGEVYAQVLTITAVYDEHSDTQHYVALFSDVTQQKEHQRQLEHIAHFDALTGLPNRVLLSDRLHQSLVQAQRRDQLLVVAYLDIDGFKRINDRHGHETGDRLLVAIAARMQQALRDGDTIARIGGDDFVAVLPDLTDVNASVPHLTRLLEAAAEPVEVDGQTLKVSASIGVSLYPQSEEVAAEQLLRQADQAMYQAKVSGKNRFHIFDAEHDRSIRGHHESVEHIRRAIAGGEFVLHYQPKVNMRTGQIVGAEALIRWQHPERGLLAPNVFLPVIEEDPLAVQLGEWVIDTALAQMEAWRGAGLELPVSVNIGALHLQQSNFVTRLHQLLAAHPGIAPEQLELEILETSAVEDTEHVSQVMHACEEIGVNFALDDFGTGYSSLTYLKRLPASVLKIDKSFVRDMLDDPEDLAILEGVLGLATAFRRQPIAEGVETVEHGRMLLQLGCTLAQGFGIARPMPAEGLLEWSGSWEPDAAWNEQEAMSRDDLPLLFASVEHRAWIKAVGKYLRGERKAPPPLHHHRCRFGQWLDGQGRARHGAHPTFRRIETLHGRVHALAAELVELREQDGPGLPERFAELLELRDGLLELLKGLADAASVRTASAGSGAAEGQRREA